jgi:hypothetical protein
MGRYGMYVEYWLQNLWENSMWSTKKKMGGKPYDGSQEIRL